MPEFLILKVCILIIRASLERSSLKMQVGLFLFWSPNLHHDSTAEMLEIGNWKLKSERTTQETRNCDNSLRFSRKAEY